MKRILLLTVCILSLFGQAKAQSIVAGHITVIPVDTMYHDSTTCSSYYNLNYNITIDSSYVGEVLNIVDTASGFLMASFTNTTGIAPWSLTANIASYQWEDFIIYGGYARFVVNPTKITCGLDTVHYIVNGDSLAVSNPCTYNSMSGTVYIDHNSNCVFDGTDVVLGPFDFEIMESLSSPAASSKHYGLSSTGGMYGYSIQQSWMTSWVAYLPAYYAFIFPYSPCFTGPTTYTTLPQTGVDFPLQCTSNIDVQCYPLAPAAVRLRRSFYMQPYVSNTGCDTAAGQMILIKDSRVTYDALMSTHPADTVRGDTLIWNYSGLSNLSGGAYWNSFLSDIYLTPDTTLAIGDTLCFRCYTNVPAADINPSNNDFTVCLPVVYSYDPNIKEVTPQGTGTEGYIPATTTELSYNLHFQNTGTASANDIVIIDTLDSHVNPATLRVLGTSHSMTPKWLATNVVQFNFNNIFLPDSGTNMAASQGEVRFSIGLNTGLTPGTQIKNKGYIYFDLNPPVITNTALNTIAMPNAIEQVIVTGNVNVYPNPASDHIVVDNFSDGEISVVNLNGAVIMKQASTNSKTTIDISALPSGIYVLKTVNKLNTVTTKFTKY